MLENGVGMVRDFIGSEFPTLPSSIAPTRVLIGTGSLFAPILVRALEPLQQIQGLSLEVRALDNKSFGSVTSVAGLLTGRCFLEAIQPSEADVLLVSPSTLRYGTELMLDEISLSDLRSQLKMDVRSGGKTLSELIAVILESATVSNVPQFGLSAHSIKDRA